MVRNPEVQEKVFQEVEKNLPFSSPATVQALANLPYLKVFIMLVKEHKKGRIQEFVQGKGA